MVPDFKFYGEDYNMMCRIIRCLGLFFCSVAIGRKGASYPPNIFDMVNLCREVAAGLKKTHLIGYKPERRCIRKTLLAETDLQFKQGQKILI